MIKKTKSMNNRLRKTNIAKQRNKLKRFKEFEGIKYIELDNKNIEDIKDFNGIYFYNMSISQK